MCFEKNKFIEHVKLGDLPFAVVVGDMLKLEIKPDIPTTLWNAHRITSIEKDGTIRVQCINYKKCNKKECTYLNLYDFEIAKAKVDNTITESKRLGGITF